MIIIKKSNKMNIILKYNKNINNKTYFSFNLIDVTFINTNQVWRINLCICNILLSIIKEKIKEVKCEHLVEQVKASIKTAYCNKIKFSEPYDNGFTTIQDVLNEHELCDDCIAKVDKDSYIEF